MDIVKISAVHLYKYSIPLVRPLLIKDHKIVKREGYVIHLKSTEGYEGFGDVAPLPGLSHEDLSDAYRQIGAVKPYLLNQPLPAHPEFLDGQMGRWLKPFLLKPSVLFGLETAILNLISQSEGRQLYDFVSVTGVSQIPLTGLLQGTIKEVVDQSGQMIRDGYTALKLKVGKNFDDDLRKVQAVSKVAEGRALLHLDANQRWDFDEAVSFFKEVGLHVIDYVEEPFGDVERIPEFFEATSMPVALDESLTQMPFTEFKSISGVYFLILKPTILGGVEKVWQIIHAAQKLAIQTVLSSCFETGLGLLMIAHLSARASHRQHAGLDTIKWFSADVVPDKWNVHHGRVDLHDARVGGNDLCFNLLKNVEI